MFFMDAAVDSDWIKSLVKSTKLINVLVNIHKMFILVGLWFESTNIIDISG